VYALLQQFRHRLRGHLDIAEQQHRLQLVIRQVQQHFVVLLHQEAVARFPQYRALFRQV